MIIINLKLIGALINQRNQIKKIDQNLQKYIILNIRTKIVL